MPKRELKEVDVINIMDEFINDRGLWFEFKEFIEAKGYTLEELGFPE